MGSTGGDILEHHAFCLGDLSEENPTLTALV